MKNSSFEEMATKFTNKGLFQVALTRCVKMIKCVCVKFVHLRTKRERRRRIQRWPYHTSEELIPLLQELDSRKSDRLV